MAFCALLANILCYPFTSCHLWSSTITSAIFHCKQPCSTLANSRLWLLFMESIPLIFSHLSCCLQHPPCPPLLIMSTNYDYFNLVIQAWFEWTPTFVYLAVVPHPQVQGWAYSSAASQTQFFSLKIQHSRMLRFLVLPTKHREGPPSSGLTRYFTPVSYTHLTLPTKA